MHVLNEVETSTVYCRRLASTRNARADETDERNIMSRITEEAVLRDDARRAAAMNEADARSNTNGGSVRAATWRDVPMQRRCEREDVVTDGHLTTASGALWWTCDSCDLEVDVTDQVRRLFRSGSR